MSQYYSLEIGKRQYFFADKLHLEDAKERSQGMGASDTFYMQCATHVYDFNAGQFIKSRDSMLGLLRRISETS